MNSIAAAKLLCWRMRCKRSMTAGSTGFLASAMPSGVAQYAHSDRSVRCSLAPQFGQCVRTVTVDIGAEVYLTATP